MNARVIVAKLIRERVWVLLVAMLAYAGLTIPGFLSSSNLGLTLDQATPIGLMAVGLTLCLIVGQVDLSSGAVVTLSGIVAIGMQGPLGAFPAVLAGITAGLACGAVNGILISKGKNNSLVVTLASGLFIVAFADYLTASKPEVSNNPLYGSGLLQGIVGDVTPRTLIFLATGVLLALFLRFTGWGRTAFALGSNPASAEDAGVRTDSYVIAAFVFAGGCAGAAGVFLSLSTGSGSSTYGGFSMTISVLTAVVIGGTRLEGGQGSAIGTIGGVMTLAALTAAMNYDSVEVYTQEIVVGFVLVLLVVVDALGGSGTFGGSSAAPRGSLGSRITSVIAVSEDRDTI